MRRRASHLVLALATGLAAFAAAGCGSVSDQASRTSLGALQTPAPPEGPPAPSDKPCSQTIASFRPTTLPPAGQMPAGTFMRRIEKRGYLIAGVDQNTLLFAYRSPLTGRLQGFEIDLLRQIAKAIFGDPNKIVFKAITTDQRPTYIEAGKVDLVADAYTITCARWRKVSFSTTYYDAKQRVLVPKNSHVRGIGDLGHERVCSAGHISTSTSLATIARQPSHPIPYGVPQRTDCLVDLQEGKVAAISTDDAILLGFKAQDPYTKIVGPPFADNPYGIAINRGHRDFVRFVNAVLAHMRTDGAWAAVYHRWLGRYHRTPAPPAAHYRD